MDLLIFIIINLLQAIYQETTIRKRKEQREKNKDEMFHFAQST